MIPAATRLAHLAPPQRAEFTVASRLLSCLVTEYLVRALYFPLSGVSATGFALILLHDPSEASNFRTADIRITDIFALVPLQGIPILNYEDGSTLKEITSLNSLDLVPLPLVISKYDQLQGHDNPASLTTAILDTLNAYRCLEKNKSHLEICCDPVFFWRNYARYANLGNDLTEEIAQELANSVNWQAYLYQHPPAAPTFESTNIEWEQSIVEGHPYHPMHMLRYFVPPLPNYAPGTYDLYHVKLRFMSIPKNQLKITNDFEKYIQPVIEAASRHTSTQLKVPEDHLILPVHELRIPHIQERFPDIDVLPAEFTVSAHAQQSIRSVEVPDAYRDLSLKFPLGIKLAQHVRTLSPGYAYLGPRFAAQVVPHLKLDPNVLIVAKELASVVHAHPDPDVAKHCGAIVRESHENNSKERGERAIVCSALFESGHAGEGGHLPAVIRIFQLDTEEKRRDWLDRFVRIFFQAFLPPIINNGVTFECHSQNCLARFDLKTKELRGFVIRDLDGVRIHPETLYASTGVELNYLPGQRNVVPDLDGVYDKAYITGIHNLLQQLIRVLDLHYNDQGWEIVRRYLFQSIPKDHPLYNAWLSPERKMKAISYLRQRIAGPDRIHVSPSYSTPNLIIRHNRRYTNLCSDEL